jgi:hypothetical protein
LFTIGYKRLIEEDLRLLDGGVFLLGGFWLKGNCWRIAEGIFAEEKIAKGKELLKGNY